MVPKDLLSNNEMEGVMMVLFRSEIRIRDDNAILIIDRIGFLDTLLLTTIIKLNIISDFRKEIIEIEDGSFASGLPGVAHVIPYKIE